MKIKDAGEYYKTVLDDLTQDNNPQSLWQDERQYIFSKADSDFENADDLLQVLHLIHRIRKISIANLADNKAFREEFESLHLRTWKDFVAPDVPLEQQHSLAKKLYNVKPGTSDVPFIVLGDNAREIGRWLIEKCISDKMPFIVKFVDDDFDALVLNHADEDAIDSLAQATVDMGSLANKRIGVSSSSSDEKKIDPDPAKKKRYTKGIEPLLNRARSGDMFFTITRIPSHKDAEIDEIPYDDYMKLFFEMCDQPWAEIEAAQAALIEKFNAAKHVRITNNDGTDVSMDIDGFTFANSVIAKNIPGSEIFSAPRRDSVNGIVVARGKFLKGEKVIRNLTLKFNKGYLENFDADEGLEAFKQAISIDPGARYVGELGIGTNPYLKRHVANGLLVEKIGGSFHLALGACYTLKEYEGVPVNVDNGNESALHWDITTMLFGKEGCIYLDGKKVMVDGRFIGDEYTVLNEGWKAMPQESRPAWFKN